MSEYSPQIPSTDETAPPSVASVEVTAEYLVWASMTPEERELHAFFENECHDVPFGD